MSNTNIIIITDVIEMKNRKEEELAYYQEQLEILISKMEWTRKEIDLTEHIIGLIEREKADL